MPIPGIPDEELEQVKLFLDMKCPICKVKVDRDCNTYDIKETCPICGLQTDWNSRTVIYKTLREKLNKVGIHDDTVLRKMIYIAEANQATD